MNLTKSQDYFNPHDVKCRCHLIGCGSVGSTVAELLVRLGIKDISLYDFDTVSSHNLANQMFFQSDIKRPKVEAVKEMLCRINPEAESVIQIYKDGWTPKTRLSGYVFLCVDNIDLRREIATANKSNQSIRAMFDFRTRLEDAQHYAADWKDPALIKNFLMSMDFSHEEAHELTPVTACNIEIGVAPTVRIICAYGVANFMNFIRTGELKKIIETDAFKFDVSAY
ncbi:MAG: ThiF family adenylyltransferase [Firmicutes bacterium]|nr:ThiF family adenylyltransferase [Bacillota bacterium]